MSDYNTCDAHKKREGIQLSEDMKNNEQSFLYIRSHDIINQIIIYKIIYKCCI